MPAASSTSKRKKVKKKVSRAGRGLSAFAQNRIFSNAQKKKIAHDMLERYTGSEPGLFRKQIILTNFDYYIEEFERVCGPKGLMKCSGSAMTASHSKTHDVSIVNFSIGSPTAALIIELLSVVDPTAVLLLGMCGGLHRSLKVGDFILPIAAIRGEGVSQHFMPPENWCDPHN
jgi:AMP nucleosidase